MSDADFTPLRGAPDAQGYPTLPQEPTYGYNDRRNFLTPPPRSSFAEPARAAECYQLGAPRSGVKSASNMGEFLAILARARG